MASEPSSEDVARLLERSYGVGRVIGALRRTSSTDSDIEFLMLIKRGDRFLVRHVILDLHRLNKEAGADTLYVMNAQPPYPHTDSESSSLADALAFSAALSSRSSAVPLPALEAWTKMGGPFEKQLKRYRLRFHVPWLPDPPRWERITHSTIGVLGVIATFLLLGADVILGVGADVAGPDAADLSIRELFAQGLWALAALGALVCVVLGVGSVRDRWKRHSNPPEKLGSPGQ